MSFSGLTLLQLTPQSDFHDPGVHKNCTKFSNFSLLNEDVKNYTSLHYNIYEASVNNSEYLKNINCWSNRSEDHYRESYYHIILSPAEAALFSK